LTGAVAAGKITKPWAHPTNIVLRTAKNLKSIERSSTDPLAGGRRTRPGQAMDIETLAGVASGAAPAALRPPD
jgi:hypothetical protein